MRGIRACLCALWAFALLGPGCALAAEAKQLEITQFTLQPTQAVPGHPLASEPYVFDQAGGHPFALTSTIRFASEEVGLGHVVPTREPTDVIVDLPPGLLANAQVVPGCPSFEVKPCPADTQVGEYALRSSQVGDVAGPIVNLEPPPGEPAELALETQFKIRFPLVGRVVRGPNGYVFSLLARGLPSLGIVSITMTLWGTPADPVHDPQRGLFCSGTEADPEAVCEGGGKTSARAPTPFITMPGACSATPPVVSVWADSWEQPGRFARAQAGLEQMSGCGGMPFYPQVVVEPDTLLAEAPVALDVGIGVRQSEGANVPAAPALRSATITLPQGVSINPGFGDGAEACPRTGPQGIDIPTGVGTSGDPLNPYELGEGEAIGADGSPQLAPGNCPPASTIGLVEADTPLLPQPLEGRAYLASPGCGGPGEGPCGERDAVDGNLYRIYLELGGRGALRPEGAIVKLEATVAADPTTGQLTVRLSEAPQLPIERLSIALFGGPRSLLVNPSVCGPANTTADLQPWASPDLADASASSFYEVDGCPDPSPFDPTLLAGSELIGAGAFTPFTLAIARGAREQYLAQIQLHAPLGLSAMLASVPLCEEPQASAGDCSQASRIGSSTVAAGNASESLYLPGQVYLTGGYRGAPYGLSIVTRAVAGPLDLGSVVLRARVDVDPHTAALTITSDPLPQILLGVPLRLSGVTLDIDRAGFILNPTDCRALPMTAAILGAQGAVADRSEPFAVGGCRGLRFDPTLSASTSARTSLGDGASLDVKLSQPQAKPGMQANLAKLRLSLPRVLPTRLTALQNSCPPATFASNAAGCPPASIIGSARARTPLLAGLLSGPVYLVSHGRNAFPAPTIVLQGDGVRLDLAGTTGIAASGATSISFSALPDVPLYGVELSLPRGPHSALTATGNLCAAARTVRKHVVANLPLSVELAAQNGIVLHPAAKIAVLGCPRPRHRST